MAGRAQATILHADLDAFYASVEQLLDPSLRGRPVAVGGGVVLAASYEAKAHGVTGGMAGWRARQLCPELVFTGGHFSEYQRLGDRVVELFHDITPLVERISIDEAFLDVGGATHLFGPPERIAADLRARVRDEVGLAISVGVATTKHLAKVASQVAKPDGLVVVEAGDEQRFLDPLPVELLWGVGPATRAKLADRGIHTVGELAAASPESLRGLLGTAIGSKLGALATNDDVRQVETTRRARSVGAQSALGHRPATVAELRPPLAFLADRVAGRLRRAGRAGRTVTVRVRFGDMRAITRSVTLPYAVSSTLTLGEIALELVGGALGDEPREREVTLVAISVSHLEPADEVLQLELPVDPDERHRPGSPTGAARSAVDHAMDAVRDRFGRSAVGYAPVVFRDDRGVPDDFRELAERELPERDRDGWRGEADASAPGDGAGPRAPRRPVPAGAVRSGPDLRRRTGRRDQNWK